MDPYGDVNDFVTPDSEDEEDNYFEPVRTRGKQREATPAGLGPPVTTDERMEALPELHRVFVYQFVEEAKKEVDRIKNDRNLSRLFFTESNLREMAIGWTVTLDDMRQISGINVDAVTKWGKYIVPIVARYSKNYDDAMSGREDRDIDKNHQNVIDLCSDDEDEEEFDLNDSDAEAILQAEQQGSKYFPTTHANSNNHAGARRPRQSSRGSSSGPRRGGSSRGGGGSQFRARAPRKSGPRKSAGSASGQSTGAGVAKRRAPSGGGARKSGGGGGGSSTSNTTTSTTAAKAGNLFKQFGNRGGRGGGMSGGGGSGIGMMPT